MDLTYKRKAVCTSTRVISFSPTLNFITSHGGFKPAPTQAKGRTFFRSEEERNTYYSSSPFRTPTSDQTDRLGSPLYTTEQEQDPHRAFL